MAACRHWATAARVTYPAALQRCELDAPLLAAGLLTADERIPMLQAVCEFLIALPSQRAALAWGISVKNKFFTDEFIRLASIVPAAQTSQAEKEAW